MTRFQSFAFIALLIFGLAACVPNRHTRTTDVLVIGGTTGGFAAGLQCARLNVPTIIVEETTWLGGMMTSAGVSAMDGNSDLNSGIWDEFRSKIRAHYGGEKAVSTGWVSSTLFEPHIGDSIIKSMVANEKQLSVVYGYHLTDIIKENEKVTGAKFENEKGEHLIVIAKVVVDATDLGDGLKMAGADYDLGMDARSVTGEEAAFEKSNEIVQDLTWVAVLKDYGIGTDNTIEKPVGYDSELFRGSCLLETAPTVWTPIESERMLTYGKLPNNKYMINWPNSGNDYYLNVVEMSREERKEALKQAKDKTLKFVYYIQTELGYKNLGLADDEFPTEDKLAIVPYHREGRRLKGVVRFTLNHVLDIYSNEPLYRTGISVGNYMVDHHHKCKPELPKIKFPRIPSFNVPLGALIPDKVDGLIVADKAISVSNLLNGSTRLQPCVMLTGQAAGILAALSVKNNINVRDVNIRNLQQILLDAKGYLMPLTDIAPQDKDFQEIQRVTSCGILKVKGESIKWTNRTWFYPDTTITINQFADGLHSYESSYPVYNDNSILTINKAVEMISILSGKNIMPDVKSLLETNSVKKFNPHQAITKRELSIIIDKIINPFEQKEIDFNGNYK